MSMPEQSLIGTIREACIANRNGRTADEIMLLAASALGALAAEAFAAPEAPHDAICEKAMDLMIGVVDHLHAHQPDAGEEALIDNSYARSKREGKPYTYYALGWGNREKPRAHLQSRVLDCFSHLGALNDGPEDEYYRERAWRLDVSHNLLSTCLHLIAGERPGITDEQLIDLANARLEILRWSAIRPEAAPEP